MSNTDEMLGKTKRGFRRAWFGGLRADDVEGALDQLEERNAAVEAKLAASEETARALGERLASADGTLKAFEATIAHLSNLLSLAEERAAQVEQEAHGEAARMRAEAEQEARELESQAAALVARRQQILDDLTALRATLTAVVEQIRPAPSTNVRALPGRDSHHLPQAGAGS